MSQLFWNRVCMLKAAAKSGNDCYLALLTLRYTPVMGLKYSPAQILMGRVLRSTLPTSKAVLQPYTSKHIQIELQQRQSKQKSWFDRTAAPLPALRQGQRIYMRIKNTWKPAAIVSIRDEPHSYDFTSSHLLNYELNKWYAYLACCPRRGLRAR